MKGISENYFFIDPQYPIIGKHANIGAVLEATVYSFNGHHGINGFNQETLYGRQYD